MSISVFKFGNKLLLIFMLSFSFWITLNLFIFLHFRFYISLSIYLSVYSSISLCLFQIGSTILSIMHENKSLIIFTLTLNNWFTSLPSSYIGKHTHTHTHLIVDKITRVIFSLIKITKGFTGIDPFMRQKLNCKISKSKS